MQVGQPAPAAAVTLLSGQNDQVKGVAGLHLQPSRAPPTGLVGRGQRLDHHPFVAATDGVGRERRRFPAIGLRAGRRIGSGRGVGRPGPDHQPRRPQRRRHDRGQRGLAVGTRAVQQVLAVPVQEIEEEHRERLGRTGPAGGSAARGAAGPDPARGDLERTWPAVGPQRDDLAIEHRGPDRQGQHGRHHLGQPGGDVVQAAGEDPDLVARPVDLHPDPVELPLDRRRTDPAQRRVDIGRALREHRPQAAAHLQVEPGQPGSPVPQRRGGHDPEITPQHQGPADTRGRYLGGPRHGLDHNSFESALARFAGQQTAQEVLLNGGRFGEQPSQQQPSATGRARARLGADALEQRIHRPDRQRRCFRRRREIPQTGPTHADLALHQPAGQERDGDRHVVGAGPAQDLGQRRDLHRPGRAPGHRARRVSEIGQ